MLFEDIKALDAVNAFTTNRGGNTMPATNKPKPTVEANRAESDRWLDKAITLDAKRGNESDTRVNLAIKVAQRFEDFAIACKKQA
jgi:hypothetical protein